MGPGSRDRALRAALLPIGLSLLAALGGLAHAQTSEPPPPTPVPIRGGGTSPSPFPQSLRTPSPGTEPPELRAEAAVLVDLDTGQVLFGLNPRERRPIASLTKIMTAYLVLRGTDPTDRVTVGANAASGRVVGLSTLGLVEGERVRVGDLLHALMLQSANDAAVALAEHVGGTVEGFVGAMNEESDRLGLARSRFASPNGLDDTGYSTARDLARLTRAAYRIPAFGEVVATRFHTIPASEGEPRTVQNRNALLWLYPGAIGVKTGFTSAAGFNLVAAAERGNERLVAVVLGEPGEPFSDAAALLDYGFTAFERRPVIVEGRRLGDVAIDGRAVPVAAGSTLEALVPVEARVRRTIVLDPRVGFPPARGERVGVVALSVSEMALGEVPLLVTDVPPPPPVEGSGPWWRRALGAVVRAGAALVDALFD